MAFILRCGLETNPVLHDRLAYLVNNRALWTFAWLTWTAAAFAILNFYIALAESHAASMGFAVLLTVAAIGPDLAAQAIEIGVLPPLAYRALTTNAEPDLFLTLHRVAVMLSGYLANGLYSATALILTWSTRRAFPAWVWVAGLATGAAGLLLSAAALADSTPGMFWANVLLVPALLLWLAGVGGKLHSLDSFLI
jgi:hypothetical protein